MTASPPSDQPGRLPTRCSPSNISALIVGAGVAGLMAGLECWRKGHNVRIIEKSPARLTSGELPSTRTQQAQYRLARTREVMGEI